MSDYRDAKVHDWWKDKEYKEYFALLETVEGQLRLITTTVEEPK